MHVQVVAGLGLALACAAGTNLGGLWKHRGALESGDVDIRRPLKTAVALFQSKWWTIGWIVAAFGWLLHVGALALAPLSLAQAVISGGLVLLGVLAERFFGFNLTKRQWVGLALVSLGMAMLAATAGSEGNHSSYQTAALAGFESGTLALAAGSALGCRLWPGGNRGGVLLGISAGLLFGVSDVSIKAVTGGSGGPAAVLSPWTLTAVVAAIAAFYASARSLQIADGVAVITATAAAANILGIAAGVAVFGDPLGSDAWTAGGRLAAFVLVVVSVGLIPAPVRAQRSAAGEQQEEPAVRRGTPVGETPSASSVLAD